MKLVRFVSPWDFFVGSFLAVMTTTVDKRKVPPATNDGTLVKRMRPSDDGGALTIRSDRTSSLAAPVMALTEAHAAEILDVRFSRDGDRIAAASADHTVSLWETFGEHRNIGLLRGHKSAVTCLAWCLFESRTLLVSGSADHTLVLWDPQTGERVRRFRGHRGIVNGVACTRSNDGRIASASDDGRVLLWDCGASRYPIDAIELGYPITCIEFSDDASHLILGGLDNAIHVVDIATKERRYSLLGHTNTVTSVALSHAGTRLVSAGMDDTVRVWDIQPFSASTRLLRTLHGMASGFENLLLRARWSRDDEYVGSGSADLTSNIWHVDKAILLLKLPGHRGTCTAVDFHPHQPIIVSSSTDTTLLVGELDP